MNLKKYKQNLKREYQNTFKKNDEKHRFQFKIRYAFLAVAVVIFSALLIQHIWVYNYNAGVEKHNEAINNRIDLGKSSQLTSINTKKDYEQVITQYNKLHVYKSPKTSILSAIFSLQFISCGSSKDMRPDVAPAPEANPFDRNAFQTNVQVEGIDEADVAKCDGKYIYYIYNFKLYVYDIQNQKMITSIESEDALEVFVYKNKIITIGNFVTAIYELNNDTLIKKDSKLYQRYITSRLIENKLYLVCGKKIDESDIQYEECFYDNCSKPSYLFSLYCLNLDEMENKETQLISSDQAILYTSNQHFYLASYQRGYTSISIVSYDLEPVGVVYVNGSVLNQFSMDEYQGYLRVVSTDTNQNAEELNAITIFELTEELKKIGYLNQGIGKGRQVVKSVRFDKNRCYVVTYENKDPLYEIDCSHPESPKILSAYEAPGYSNYLHTFTINDKEYVLGLGYTDSRVNTKISVYEKTEQGTSQIGKDFILTLNNYYDKGNYSNPTLLSNMFENHRALFIYSDTKYLYLGAQVAKDAYLLFKIDVEAEGVISIYKTIELNRNSNNSRLFFIDNKIYVTNCDIIIVDDFS